MQNEIRYLALHSGIGGYKPNSPNKVVSQRFGDCKDKSVLLVTILKAMDIKAYPTLVNTILKHQLTEFAPSTKIFDHCIVKVIDKHDTTLWYDPTLTNQAGYFNKLFIPDYRYGLVLDKNLHALDTISNFNNNMVEVFTTYTLNEMGKDASLEIKSKFYDGEADFVRGIFKNNTKEVIAQELLKSYVDNYGGISSLSPPKMVDDSLKNEVVLLEKYHIDSIWSPSVENPKYLNLTIDPSNLSNSLIMPNQLKKKAPFALSYPMVRTQHIEVKLPEAIRAKAESLTINSDYFYYEFNSKYDNSANILTLDYYYKNQNDHVPLNKFDTFYKDMLKLDQNLGYLITTNKGTQNVISSSFSIEKLLIYVLIGVVVILMIIVIALVKQKQNK